MVVFCQQCRWPHGTQGLFAWVKAIVERLSNIISFNKYLDLERSYRGRVYNGNFVCWSVFLLLLLHQFPPLLNRSDPGHSLSNHHNIINFRVGLCVNLTFLFSDHHSSSLKCLKMHKSLGSLFGGVL